MYFGLLLVLGVPIAVVVLAVRMDTRSGRGYGLALLAAGVLVLDVSGVIAISQAGQRATAPHMDTLGLAFVDAVYSLIGLLLGLALALGGIAETIIARQWRWLAVITIGVIVPAVVILASGTGRVPDVLGALGVSRGVEVVIVALMPVLVILIYATDRIRRTGPARQPAPAQSR